MGPDAVEEEEEEPEGGKSAPRLTDGSKVHAKDKKLFERIEKKRAKIGNMQTEIQRIREKEMKQGGLSEGALAMLQCALATFLLCSVSHHQVLNVPLAGQEKQIARNTERMMVLEKEIEALEGTIHDRYIHAGSMARGTPGLNKVARAAGRRCGKPLVVGRIPARKTTSTMTVMMMTFTIARPRQHDGGGCVG